jgi:hypothetical protein
MKAMKPVIAVCVVGIALVIAYVMSGQAKTPLDANKDTVTNFYKVAFNDHKPAAAIEKYVGGSYIQHNPTVADGSLPSSTS